MKRFMRLFLVLVLCTVMATLLGMTSYAQDPATAAVGTAQVTYGAVNVRTGPSTNYTIVGHMTKGTLVPVLDFNPVKNFIKVSFEGEVRYVHQNSIIIVTTQPIQKTPVASVAPVTPAPSTPDPTAAIDRVSITVDALNVRSGPGKSFAVVGKLTKGTIVPVISYDGGNGYAKISYQGDMRYAYLSGYSSRVQPDSTQTPTVGTARITANVLNVRSGPGTNYAIVGKLTYNTVVPVLAYNAGNGFAKISYQDQVRYVSMQYLA